MTDLSSHTIRMYMGEGLGQLQVKSRLSPRLWDGDSMRPPVRVRMLEIVEEFLEFINMPIELDDIRLTGSMANYNYTDNSDIDLHLVVDFSAVNSDTDLVGELFMAKKGLWNDKHRITIGGHEVEVYVEDLGEPHRSTGVYSLVDDEWVKKPDPDKMQGKIDYAVVMTKVRHLRHHIGDVADMKPSERKLAAIERLKEKIKKMRQDGLDSKGELSDGNLIFKVLRMRGWVDRLYRQAILTKDALLSLNGHDSDP